MAAQVRIVFNDALLPPAASANAEDDAINVHLLGNTVRSRAKTGSAGGTIVCDIEFMSTIPQPALGGLVIALAALPWVLSSEVV